VHACRHTQCDGVGRAGMYVAAAAEWQRRACMQAMHMRAWSTLTSATTR
jgi:hypothetical protein